MIKDSFSDSKEVFEYLLTLDNIIIFTHEHPDGDAIGSVFALQKALKALGKTADVYFPESLPMRYSDIVNENTYITNGRENYNYSVCVSLDCGTFERLETFDKRKPLNIPILNIDHHQDNTLFGTHNFIDLTASATAEIIFDILMSAGEEKITGDIGDCLLIGIMLDTGGLRFDNTNANILRKVARLIDLGANYSQIVKNMYFTKPLGVMTLESEVILEHIKITCNGKFAYAYLSENLLNKHKIKYRDTEGTIDYIRTINGLTIVAIISKNKDGFRVSLRSNNPDYPVSTIAQEMSGGGHKLAAGCTIRVNTIEEAEKILLEKVSSVFK